jgi:hypothetical protein
MAFTATITGLDEIVQAFEQTNFEKDVAKAVGSVARELNSVLSTQVKATYSIGNRSLNSVLVGGTECNLKRGLGFIEKGLVYQSKPILLADFPNSTIGTGILSSFIAPNIFTPELAGKIKRKKQVENIVVNIRKGKQTLIRGAFRGEVKDKIRLMRRKNFFTGGETWDELPSRANLLGKRSPYYWVNGPSLSQMAAKVYDTNPYLQKFKDDFGEKIAVKLWGER